MGSACGKTKQPNNGVINSHQSIDRSHVSDVKQTARTDDIYDTMPLSPRRKTVKKKGAVINSRQEPGNLREALSAAVSDRPKTHWEIQNITMAIHRHSVLADLTEDAREEVISCMRHFELSEGQTVFEAGDEANHFFVVGSGSLEVLVNRRRVNILKPGDSFGEQALLHNTPRSATVRTLEKCTLWGVDRKGFREAVELVNGRSYLENKEFLESVSMFSVLTQTQKENLLAVMAGQKFPAGKRIVLEGETGELLYIIKSGSVTCSKEGKEIRKMRKGDYFGEQALLTNSIRTATVVAYEEVRLLSISRNQLTEVLGSSLQRIIYRNTQRMSFEQSPSLSQLSRDQKEALIDHLIISSPSQGEVILPSGTNLSAGIYLVLKGELKTRSGASFAKRFQVVGGEEMMRNESVLVSEDVLAEANTDIGYMPKDQFEQVIGGNISHITAQNEALSVLRRVSIFRAFSRERLLQVYSQLKVVKFAAGEYIFHQGDPGESFYIVKSGQVAVKKDAIVLRTVTKNGFFGERALLLGEKRTASILAEEQAECWVLLQHDFFSIIDESIRAILKQRMQLQDDTVALDQLVVIKELGKGMFGSVFLVVHKEKKTCYALKCVSRQKIRVYDIASNVVLERQLLLQIDHIFIMKLVKTFKDRKRVYFLAEFVNGQDLFDVIRIIGLLSEADCKFYVAGLVLILEHLHERKIVYRDLKPENVMVDEMGYPKLIDFGTAKLLEGRTFTIVGTPHYMAPEVVLGKGYMHSVDIWSLGVMLFEFICGGVPFGEEEDDPFMIYERILRDALRFPATLSKPSPLRSFLELLLNKNPALRLQSSTSQLKDHPWLYGFDWVPSTQEKMSLKQLKPPLVPKLRNLQPEIEVCLSQNRSMDRILDEADRRLAGDSEGEEHPEEPGWDRDF